MRGGSGGRGGGAEEECRPRPWRESEPAGPLPRPIATSHLHPPRPCHRHRPTRHAEPGGQHHCRCHLPSAAGTSHLGQQLELCSLLRWGGGEPASDCYWLWPRPEANSVIPLGSVSGPGTPLAPPPRSLRNLFIPLASCANSRVNFLLHWLRPLVRVKVPIPLGPLTSFRCEIVSHSIGRTEPPRGGIFLQLALNTKSAHLRLRLPSSGAFTLLTPPSRVGPLLVG